MLTTSDRATRSVMLRESGFDCAKNNSANHQRTPGRRARNFGSGSVERSTSSKSCAENSAKGASGAGQKELVVQNVFASGPILGYPGVHPGVLELGQLVLGLGKHAGLG